MSEYFDEITVEVTDERAFIQSGPRPWLPLSLAAMVLIGATMPWVVIRPLGESKYSYNLTDVPGGIGVLVTVFFLLVISAVVAVFKRNIGVVMIALVGAFLGWMAAISGMLLGVVGSLIPSINVAGIDLSKAQVGQGSGVVMCVLSSLALVFFVVRFLDPINKHSVAFQLPVLPLAAVLPLIIVTLNLHQGWLGLGSDDSNFKAEIPGDALYGSGLLIVAIWVTIGLWFACAVIQSKTATRIVSCLTLVIGFAVSLYTVIVWMGGRLLQWLLPSKVENWTAIDVRPNLYFSLLAGISLVVIAFFGLFEKVLTTSIKLNQEVTAGNRKIAISDTFAIGIGVVLAIWMGYRIVV